MDSSDMLESNCKLHDAVVEEDIETTKHLLQAHCCDVNETDEKHWNGRTALHIAAMKGKPTLVSLLLENGADVSAVDSQGNTPLHWCGHTETIEILVENGANVLQCNKRGFTARALAERRGVCGSACDLLSQLELEMQETGGHHHHHHSHPQSHSQTAFASDIVRSSTTASRKRKRQSEVQPFSGLWRECASELGSRNTLLLILGLLAFSLYAAYILTGLHHGFHDRIPIDVR